MALALSLHSYHNITQNTEEKESLLIQACVKEEAWAQKILYETYYPKMIGVCMRYSNDYEDARDILNEGFIKVFRFIEKYKIGTSLESWIRRIMINSSIDYYRKEIRHRSEDIDTAMYKLSDQTDVVSDFSAQDILKAVQKLPPAYRAVFNLYVIEGYSHKEVSDELGITESTSRSNLVKARNRLKDMLEELGITR
jgi:RNA polymerase sigma-70 factor (ECF subfamily)